MWLSPSMSFWVISPTLPYYFLRSDGLHLIIDMKQTVCYIPSRNICHGFSVEKGNISKSFWFCNQSILQRRNKVGLTNRTKVKNRNITFQEHLRLENFEFIHFKSIEFSNRTFENDLEFHWKILEVEILE